MSSTSKPYIYNAPPLNLGLFDLGGVLYHANYFQIYEQAREACLRSFGVDYFELANAGTHFALVESAQRFLKPVFYGDEVSVELSCSKLGRSSFKLEYVLRTDREVNTASTSHACVGRDMKVSKLPGQVVVALESIRGQ